MAEAPTLATTMKEYAVETDPLVKSNIETRQELEMWVKEQKSALLLEQATHQSESQECARQRSEAQRKRDQLQEECRDLNASTLQLWVYAENCSSYLAIGCRCP